MSRIVFDGNHGLLTQPLKTGFTAFDGTATKWEGLVSVDVTFTQPQTVVAADDDPEWLVQNGVPTATGSIVLRSIDIHSYGKFVACVTAEGQGVRFGEDLPTVWFAFAVNENVSDGTQNKHIFFKCRVTNLPDFKSSTRNTGNSATRDITIPVAISPVFYDKGNGAKGRAIYDIVNSVADVARFTANETAIVFPTKIGA